MDDIKNMSKDLLKLTLVNVIARSKKETSDSKQLSTDYLILKDAFESKLNLVNKIKKE